MNTMFAWIQKDGVKILAEFEGRAFKHKGVALHLRKIDNLWVISLFNSGLITHGSGSTIKAAMERYETEEGAVIEGWKYERFGAGRIRDLQKLAIEKNQLQEVEYEYKNGRLVIGTRVKAGDLI